MVTKRALKIFWLAFGLFLAMAFQACSDTRFSNTPTRSMSSSSGGEGFDGKVYTTYGPCEKNIDRSHSLSVAKDYSSAQLLRKDCQDLSAPEPVAMSEIQFLANDESVLTYQDKIFDLQQEASAQKITLAWCESSGASPTANTLTWAEADNPGALFTNITEGDGAESGALVTQSTDAYHYVAAPSQSSWFDLQLGGALSYTLGTAPTRNIPVMTCSTQPSPITLVQSRAAASSGSGTQYNFTIESTGTGNLLVLGLSIFNASSQCTANITDNALNGSNSYASAGAYAQDANSGSTEIWYAPNSRAGATNLTITLNGSCSGTTPAIYFAEFSGIAPVNPLFGTPAVINGQPASTTVAAPLVETTERALVFSVASVQFDVVSLATGSPFRALPVVFGDAAAYHLPTSAGNYGAVWNQNTSGSFCASSVVFKAAW